MFTYDALVVVLEEVVLPCESLRDTPPPVVVLVELIAGRVDAIDGSFCKLGEWDPLLLEEPLETTDFCIGFNLGEPSKKKHESVFTWPNNIAGIATRPFH